MPRKSKRNIDFEMEGYEREARFNAAWGQYGATMRAQNFDREVARHDEAIKRAPTSEAKAEAKKKKEEFLKKCSGNTTLHVGYY